MKDLIIAYESYDSLAKLKFPKQPLGSVNLTQQIINLIRMTN